MTSHVAHCPNCGSAAGSADVFCGECGTSLTATAPPPPRPVAQVHAPGQPRKKKGKWLFRGILLAAVAGGVWFFFLRPANYTPPQRQQPQLPQAVAGTMREFPIDTDPNQPGRLTSVVSQSFPPGGKPESVSVPAQHLPPGITPSDLPNYGTAVTSGQYTTPGVSDPVNVHVIDTGGNFTSGPQLTATVAQATGGTRTGIEVQSPQGSTYRGERIQTPEIVIHILVNQYSATIIIVYAPTPAAQPMGERLASNVGNGRGIVDQPGMENAWWTLPSSLPYGFVLEGTMVATPSDLGLDPSVLSSGGPGGIDPEIGKFIGSLDQLLPQRFVSAGYRDPVGAEWNVLIFEYESVRKAQNLWTLLKWTVGFQMIGVQVGNSPGLTVQVDEGQILLFQKGPYFVAIMAPPNNGMEFTLTFAQSLQI
jgi:hypothetical protein